MILSFSRNFAFVAVPRTGTHAVRTQLRPLLGPHDWEQSVRYEPRFFPVPQLAALGHGHVSAAQIQPYLVPGQWARMFSFAFVRDPLDRFLSAYYFATRKQPAPEDPVAAMKAMLEGPMAVHFLFQPAHTFVCDGEGKLLVDFLGRHERFAEDFAQICARIGCDASPAEPVNASPRPERPPVDAELHRRVAEFYAEDYRLFGYPVPQ